MNYKTANSIKNFYSNKKISSSALDFLETEESMEKREKIKLKIEQIQFEAIKECTKNKEKYQFSDDLMNAIRLFNLSDEQVLELLKIDSGNEELDNNFRLSMINENQVKNIEMLSEIVDIILDKDYKRNYNPSADELCYAEKLFDSLISNPENRNLESLIKIYNILKEKILDHISKKIEFFNEKYKNDPSRKRKLDSDFEKKYFSENLTQRLFFAAESCKIWIPLDFVLENVDDIPTHILLVYYSEEEKFKDLLNTEKIQKILKKRCEERIRQEFGPGSDMIKITIDWDLNSIILFNSFSETDEDCCETRDP